VETISFGDGEYLMLDGKGCVISPLTNQEIIDQLEAQELFVLDADNCFRKGECQTYAKQRCRGTSCINHPLHGG